VVQISAAEEHNCALRGDGAVFCWGIIGGLDACWPRDFDPARAPVATAALPRPALAVTATDRRACALLDDGSAWCRSTARYSTDPGTLLAPVRVSLDCPEIARPVVLFLALYCRPHGAAIHLHDEGLA
jgi:Regulator of chromosome condensation (RCC1) repeat